MPDNNERLQSNLAYQLDQFNKHLKTIAEQLKRFNDAAIGLDGNLFICTDEVGH